MKKNYFLLSCLVCFCLFFQQTAHAQSARLGIQGILKKANGNAVDDAAYSLKFRLYEQAEGGVHIWEEVQPEVDVVGGIYTAILGSVTALNVPFDTTYYLGVSVGSTSEMLPRIQLTTAPYALSLIGNTNQFPSSGLVKADSILVDGYVRAKGGAPGLNGVNKNGYSFSRNGGDNDSGVFSTEDGRVSLYSNNSELLRVSGGGGSPTVNIRTNGVVDNSLTVQDQLIVNGQTTFNNNANFAAGKSIQYTGLNDWRLVQRVDINSTPNDYQGWFCTTELGNTTSADLEKLSYGAFNGDVIRPQESANHIMKRQVTLTGVGSYNYILVKFKYYFTDSWDADDTAIGGFCTSSAGADPAICWMESPYVWSTTGTANYTGASQFSDGATYGEMMATTSSSNFWIFFGMRTVGGGLDNERYALGGFEIWVR